MISETTLTSDSLINSIIKTNNQNHCENLQLTNQIEFKDFELPFINSSLTNLSNPLINSNIFQNQQTSAFTPTKTFTNNLTTTTNNFLTNLLSNNFTTVKTTTETTNVLSSNTKNNNQNSNFNFFNSLTNDFASLSNSIIPLNKENCQNFRLKVIKIFFIKLNFKI